MKSRLLILSLIFSQLCLAQDNSLIVVTGTKCSLAPPEGRATPYRLTGKFFLFRGSGVKTLQGQYFCRKDPRYPSGEPVMKISSQ